MVPFSSFAPDLDPTTPGIITECTNLVPTLRGYAGGPSGADVGMDALAAAALSAALTVKLDGTKRMFAGTTTKLYEKSSTSWTDVSRVAAYNAGPDSPWRFAQYGDSTIAANKGDVIQTISSGADFADLTSPKADLVCTAAGFVIVANTNDGTTVATYGNSPDRWWCCAYLDVTDWEPAIATQCATGRLVDTPGKITGLKAIGENIVAYKETSMYLGTYAGPPGVWRFDPISTEVGCASHAGIVEIDNAHLFIGNNDIYRYVNGSTPVPIGAPLREWFFDDLDPTYPSRIQSTHDRVNSLVYFHYPRQGSAGALTGCIVYNYKTDKWGVAHRDVEAVVDFVSGGFTWDTLPIIGMTWDDWPTIAYDSPYWTANSTYTAYIGTDHKVYSLTGASDSSSLTTGTYGAESEYSLLSRVTLRYLTRPISAAMVNLYQEYLGGAWTTDLFTLESSGRFDVLRAAPFHKVSFYFTGDVEVVGATADVKPAGVL